MTRRALALLLLLLPVSTIASASPLTGVVRVARVSGPVALGGYIERIGGDATTATRDGIHVFEMPLEIQTFPRGGSVPEPSLMLLGLVGAGWLGRRRRR